MLDICCALIFYSSVRKIANILVTNLCWQKYFRVYDYVSSYERFLLYDLWTCASKFNVLFFYSQPRLKKKTVSKKVAPAPLAVKKVEPKKVVNPLFEKRPKNFGIGKWNSNPFSMTWCDLWTFSVCTLRLCLFDVKLYSVFDLQDKTSNQNVTWPVSLDGRSTFVYRDKRLSYKSVWRFHHQSTNSAKHWTNRRRCNCSRC